MKINNVEYTYLPIYALLYFKCREYTLSLSSWSLITVVMEVNLDLMKNHCIG